MKRHLLSVFALSLLVVLCLTTVSAQTERRTTSAASSLYIISAKAGGVNFVEGKVEIARKNAKSGYLLKGDELEIGDQVSTGAGGKVEILLNPG
ncbi:MAG: hypothetical protein LH614_16060, partial [Pyrinomonadaceae bacterium]|nr:hypothetical protein [Pyrinomonadaceae bacterium]